MPTFRLIIVAIIFGLVAPNRQRRGFSPGWGLAWHRMLYKRTLFAWGSVMLASLYHYMHDFIYCDNRTIGIGVTLVHIWAWEHIAMLQSIMQMVYVELDDLVVWRYRGNITLQHAGQLRLPYWHRVLDNMIVFIWRPWL